MLTVDDYGTIRRAFGDGMSIREIARTFGHSRRKIRETLANPQPRWGGWRVGCVRGDDGAVPPPRRAREGGETAFHKNDTTASDSWGCE